MKNRILALIGLIAILSTSAWADRAGNGGDPNEPTFKDIAANIQAWIISGNADQLQLPVNVPLDVYKTKMVAALTNYHISFTADPISVGGGQKTCRNSIDNGQNQIVCNGGEFAIAYKNDIDSVYVLVHHEFAGLAGLEVNSGQESDYTISKQISAYLQFETVKRLPVVKQPAPDPNYPPTNTCVDGHVDDFRKNVESYIKSHVTAYGKSHGIAFTEASVNSIHIKVDTDGGFSITTEGQLFSKDGTAFNVFFASDFDGGPQTVEPLVFETKFVSKGTTREGNPIPPFHCHLTIYNTSEVVNEGRPTGEQVDLPTFIMIQNVKWSKEVTRFDSLPDYWSAY